MTATAFLKTGITAQQLKEAAERNRQLVKILEAMPSTERLRQALTVRHKLFCPHVMWKKKEETTRAAHFHLWECTWCGQQIQYWPDE